MGSEDHSERPVRRDGEREAAPRLLHQGLSAERPAELRGASVPRDPARQRLSFVPSPPARTSALRSRVEVTSSANL